MSIQSSMCISVASFPGIPTVHPEGGGGGGSSMKKETSLRPYMYLAVSAPRAGVSNIHEPKTHHSWLKTKNTCAECIVSMGDPSPLLST